MSRKDIILTLLEELEAAAKFLRHIEAEQEATRAQVIVDHYRGEYPKE